MPDHKAITDPEIHEPKGISTAGSDEVYVANGAGGGAWKNGPISGQSAATEGSHPTSDGAGSFSWQKSELVKDGWRDLIAPILSAAVPGVNPPDLIKLRDDGAGSTGIYGYGFDQTTQESVFVHFHLDHDYKVGTPIYPHIHWMPLTAGVGVVRWGIEWTFAPRAATPNAFPVSTFIYLEQAGSGTPYAHQIIEVADPGITLANAEPDTLIIARLFRDAGHANDTYAGDAVALYLDGHYQIDRFATLNKAPDFYG